VAHEVAQRGDAPALDAKAELAEFLVTVAGPENDYFERAFAELGVPESRWRDPDTRPVTDAFADLLGRAAREGGYEESLAVLLAVEWVYLGWAQGADRPEQWYYGEWIDLHDNPEFASFVGFLRDELDGRGTELSPARQRRLGDLFERAVALEVQFFDEAGGRG
jgi:thiaminase/transcriptional activator TenA